MISNAQNHLGVNSLNQLPPMPRNRSLPLVVSDLQRIRQKLDTRPDITIADYNILVREKRNKDQQIQLKETELQQTKNQLQQQLNEKNDELARWLVAN